MIWRRSYDVPPPAVSTDSEYYPGNDRRYADIPKNLLPTTESLKTTAERFLPYWKNEIFPRVLKGERLVISAHGNSLRALVMFLDQISEKDITGLNIPTACPLVYDFDEQGNVIPHPDAIAPLRGHYLGDQEVIRAKINKVANQTKKN
jgi:phosphoglycerate mutase 1 family